jgi:nucleoside-diphosphate-sugar epimerase
VQLVGTPHPGPHKQDEFTRIDIPSGLAAVEASLQGRVPHLVYVSVAHPAPVMHAFVTARCTVEAAIRAACASGALDATILRPWYVLGPGHRWPCLLLPAYAVASRFESTRETARRLGLVTLRQMVRALTAAVEDPPREGMRIVDVPGIRAATLAPLPRRHPATTPALA